MLSLINVSTGCADGITVELPAPAKKYDIGFVSDAGRVEIFPPSRISQSGGMVKIKIDGDAKIHPYQVRFIVLR